MIKIVDNWYVTVETSPAQYVVRRGKGERSRRDGWKDNVQAYCGSLARAIEYIRKQVIAERLSEYSGGLAEALRTVSEVDARFAKIIERVTA